MSIIYPWTRFWCPRTAEINLGDAGFLYDPEKEFGEIYNPDVMSYSKFQAIPFLGLLGEPGIGKSFAIQQEYERVRRLAQECGGESLFINLQSIGSEDRFERKLFQSPEFQRWREDKRPLYVFLDSLDECLISIPTVANILTGELKSVSPENLFIRIACRTLNWPTSLENAVRGIWLESDVGVFELTPLRRSDVISAVGENKINPNQFLQEVFDRDVVPLAIKPLTLQLLINVFKKHGGLPESKNELYHQALMALCEEQNLERRDAGVLGRFSPEQRYAIASRVAALTIFCGKNAIWFGPDQGDVPEQDLKLCHIAGGVETVSGHTVDVTEDSIREVLGTGLFSSRGPHRMGWSHQTYAEFLSAKFVVDHQMKPRQAMSLFCNPEGKDNKVTPQFVAAASWVAGMDEKVFRSLLKVDPEVLLSCDLSTASNEDRRNLLDNLLYLYAEEIIFDSDWSLKEKYSQLHHADISNQLRPYISDGTKGIVVRRVSIEIAEECNLSELQKDLSQVALNNSENHILRKKAVRAIRAFGDEGHIVSLKQLLNDGVGEDPDDEIKAELLRTLWPKFLTLEEITTMLSPPQRDNLIGAYFFFLKEEFAAGIQADDVVKVLNWVITLPDAWNRGYIREKLVNSILRQVIKFLENEDCLRALAICYLELLCRHVFAFEEKEAVFENDTQRLRLGAEVLKIVSLDEKYSKILFYLRDHLFYTTDVPHLLSTLSGNEPGLFQKIVAQLIDHLFVYEQSDLILEACKSNPILSEAFRYLIEPILLDSPQAEELRKRYRESTVKKKLLDPPPFRRILDSLEDSEGENADVWVDLLLHMTLEEDSTNYRWPDKDVRELPGWKAAGERVRERIIAAAMNYIVCGEPKLETLYENTTQMVAVVADHAFRILKNESPELLDDLDECMWEKWSKTFLYSARNNDLLGIELLQKAYDRASGHILDAIAEVIEKQKDSSIFYLDPITEIWDDRIATLILEKAADMSLSHAAFGKLLDMLLKHKTEGARSFASSFLPSQLPVEEHTYSKSIVVAESMMKYELDCGWPILWPLVQENEAFGCDLFRKLSSRESIIDRLTEEQASDLYVWLEHKYPRDKDEEKDDTPIGSEDFRGSILRHLRARGTEEACTAIEKIAKIFPENKWLKYTIYEAKKNFRKSCWIPLSPKSVLSLAENRKASLVRSAAELIEVIIESLERMEEKLHGVTPSVRFLWNNLTPRSENDFSDFVEIHLRDDLRQRGIIANREVEFRRLSDAGVGEKTDIVVDAVATQGERFEPVTVVIESKGCWNQELSKSLKEQLIDKYLIDERHRHGIYLIGWFMCEKWDSADYRKGRAPSMEIGDARELFSQQAEDNSDGFINVRSYVMDVRLP